MTNQKKYGLTNEQVKRLSCEIDDFVMEQCAGSLSHLIEMFFSKKVKPTLTEDEKTILRNIKSHCNQIGRDENSILYLGNCNTVYKDRAISGYFNHLFQFIQPRRRI